MRSSGFLPPASFFLCPPLVLPQETSWRCFHHVVQQERPGEVLLRDSEEINVT